MLKKILIAAILVVTACLTGSVTAPANAAESSTTVAASAQQGLTSAQRNAIQSARDYLAISAFSRSGLIDQLKFEGYSRRVSTFAVDYLKVSWKRQAVKSAKEYLAFTSFSLSGLIEQLRFEGFTLAQATYGAKRAY